MLNNDFLTAENRRITINSEMTKDTR